MAQQLIKGMYGSEFDRTGNLFGLRCGQMRGSSARMGKNNGWYNKAGEKLGFGDIAVEDFQRIVLEIEEGELFITLGEQDSFWNFVTRPGITGGMSARSADESAPGAEYVAEHCTYILSKDGMAVVSDYSREGETERNINGLQLKVLTREAAKALILGAEVRTTA